MSNVATIEPKRRSVFADMAERFGMEPVAFEATLRATVFPKDASREQLAAFLLVAKEYDLNPITKEIFAFPTRNGGIQPVVSIDGWVNIINSHPAFDGFEFDDHLDDQSNLTAITARIWRKDRSRPVVVTEYMVECRRSTETWKSWPRRMLRHKALIQGARYAFGFAGIVDPDEAERLADVSGLRDITPPAPPPAPEPPAPPTARAHPAVSGPAKAPAKPVAAASAPKPAPDDLDIPADLDRRPKPTHGEKPDEPNFGPAGPIEDPDAYLKDLDTELSQAETLEELGDRWEGHLVQEHRLWNPDREKALAAYERHEARVTGPEQ